MIEEPRNRFQSAVTALAVPAAIAALLVAVVELGPGGAANAAGAAEAAADEFEPVAAFGEAADVDVSFAGNAVGLAPTASGAGYWLVNDGGEVATTGDALHHGDLTSIDTPAAPIVDIEPTPAGDGYYLLDAVGGVFTFGQAPYRGSIPGLRAQGLVNDRVAATDLEVTPDGRGYLILDTVGGIHTFGPAPYHGSIPQRRASGIDIGRSEAMALELTPDAGGYAVLDRDGGIHTFGSARYRGSVPERRAAGVAIGAADAVDLETTPSGYLVLDGAGGVHTFGAVGFHGSAAGQRGEGADLGLRPDGRGYWIALAEHRDPGVLAPPLPPDSGAGRRVVYCNSCQRVWLVEEHGAIARSYQVSGRRGVPSPGSYEVFSKSRVSSDVSGALRLDYMTRFAHGRRLAIGFHGIPINRRTGRPIQTNGELGQFRSAGCVRQAQEDAAFLWDWAPVGTPVIVTP